MRVFKLAATAAIAAVTALALSGCMKFNADLSVSSADTISGTVVVALSSELAAMAEGSTETNTDGLFEPGQGITSAPFDDGDFVGTTYTFDNVPISEFGSTDGSAGGLKIVRDGDQLITSGSLNLAGDEGSSAESNALLGAMMSSADLRVSITYPGKVLETTGTVEGTTVTWTPVLGEDTPIEATVSAPLGGGIPWPLVGIGAGVLIGAVIVVVVLVRRRRPAGGIEPAMATDSVVSEGTPTGSASTPSGEADTGK